MEKKVILVFVDGLSAMGGLDKRVQNFFKNTNEKSIFSLSPPDYGLKVEAFLAENANQVELAFVEMDDCKGHLCTWSTPMILELLQRRGIPIVPVYCGECSRYQTASNKLLFSQSGVVKKKYCSETTDGCFLKRIQKVIDNEVPERFKAKLRNEGDVYCLVCKRYHADDGYNVYLRGKGCVGTEGICTHAIPSLADMVSRMSPTDLAGFLTDVARLATTPENRTWWAGNNLGFPDAVRNAFKKIRRIALKQ